MRILVILFFCATIWIGCDTRNSQNEIRSTDLQTTYYYHNLLFQWKDSIDIVMKNNMLNLLKGIPDQIDGFESIDFYELAPEDGEFDLLVIQKYQTKEAEEMYQIHPDHLEAKSLGPQLIKNMAEFDYWDR